MNLNKLLVRELKDLFVSSGVLTMDEMSFMTKADMLEHYSESLTPEQQEQVRITFEGRAELQDGVEDFLSMDDILKEVKDAAENAVKQNGDVKKVKAFLQKAMSDVGKAEREKELRDLLKKAKIAGAAAKPLEIIVKPVVGKDVKIKGLTHKVFPKVLQLASQRKPVFLAGPSGSGKTHLAGQLAEALGARKYGAISCSVGMSESHLQGWLLPLGKNGQFTYVPTDFVDIIEHGGVYLIDEMDNSDENMLVMLNMLLANGTMPLPQRTENPVIKMHDDTVIIAAGNTYGNGADAQYVGRNQLDAATMDRFRTGMVVMDYDKDVERGLALPEVCEWGWGIRAAIYKHGIRRIMSTRTLRDVSHMAKAYPKDWGKQKAWEEAYFADWSKDERQQLAA